MTQPNKLPWEEAQLASSSHSDLYQMREQATKEEQNAIAPYEHRAFAREAVAEKPGMALSLAVAAPIYQASKAAGFENSRSEASATQLVETYKGIGEGLMKPWEQAQKYAENIYTDAAKAVADKVRSVLPWESAKQAQNQPVPDQMPNIQAKLPTDRFEKVFANLIQQESKGVHADDKGNLTKSRVGAEGITQLMPATATDPGYGITPIKDKSESEYKRVGKQYLQAMLKEFDNDYEKALAAYNAGVGNVKKAIQKGGKDWKEYLPRKSETIPYIKNIMRDI